MVDEYRLTITVYSSNKDYPPHNIFVQIPEELALILMDTPVGQVGLGIERSGPNILLDKTRLLDFK